ncbi:MAG: hypothetical protein PHO71_14640 [Bacteroides sp.]|nr:hypothetical protein [Bacteroides sp.]
MTSRETDIETLEINIILSKLRIEYLELLHKNYKFEQSHLETPLEIDNILKILHTLDTLIEDLKTEPLDPPNPLHNLSKYIKLIELISPYSLKKYPRFDYTKIEWEPTSSINSKQYFLQYYLGDIQTCQKYIPYL